MGPASSPLPTDPQELLIMFDEITEATEEEDRDADKEEEEVTAKAQPVFFKSVYFDLIL